MTKKEILKIKNLPQTVWRYFPETILNLDVFALLVTKGLPFNNKLKENRYYSLISKFNQTQNEDEKISILDSIGDLLSYGFRISDYEPLIQIFRSSSEEIKEQILKIFPRFQLLKIVSNLPHSEKKLNGIFFQNESRT